MTVHLLPRQIRAQPALGEFIRDARDSGLAVFSIRKAHGEYIDEVHRLAASGVAEVIDEQSFIGIESNEKIRHRIFVLRARAKDSDR